MKLALLFLSVGLTMTMFGFIGRLTGKEFAVFDRFRHLPRMCGEFWVGWVRFMGVNSITPCRRLGFRLAIVGA